MIEWTLSFVAPAAAVAGSVAVAVYVAAQALLLLYASHRYVTLFRSGRSRGGPRRVPRIDAWPSVTVQLPLFDERVVAARAIAAAGALRYPGRLEIQVHDDSTDETTAIAARAVERLRAAGHDAQLLHRSSRDGFKAGALAAGLRVARGELIAVFDADFVPPPDFLVRLVPWLVDPAVGMVQARWGHLNRDASRLTAAQACMLDAHFLLEHEARRRRGLFFNFNGTAGVWRRRCIEDAGGWAHDTLTEDLDLSYRAQLRGWRFEYAADVVAPAELPSDLTALRAQQHRWAKGSIQTARKLLPRLLSEPRPWAVKLEAIAHLTANLSYPLVLLVALLLAPVIAMPSTAPRWVAWAVPVVSLVLGVLPVTVFLVAGQRGVGRPWVRVAGDVSMALVLGAGLSFLHTRAVVEALGRRLGEWRRTPKTGEGTVPSEAPPYRPRADTGAAERALAVYFTALTLAIAAGSRPSALPFAALMAAGFAYVGFRDARARAANPRRATAA